MSKFEPNKDLDTMIKLRLQVALRKGSEILRNKAKQLAPEDTGKLKRMITEMPVKDLTVDVVSLADYSEHVEFGNNRYSGTPFMRPAMNESKSEIIRQFKDII